MRWNKSWALAKRGGGAFYKHQYNKEHPMDSKMYWIKMFSIYISNTVMYLYSILQPCYPDTKKLA